MGSSLAGVRLSGFRDATRDRASVVPLLAGEVARAAGGGALVVHVALGWSAEARQQAQALAQHRPRPPALLGLLVDGARVGQRADVYDLVAWAAALDVDYPMGIDTLRVERAGAPDAAFWAAADRLAARGACPGR